MHSWSGGKHDNAQLFEEDKHSDVLNYKVKKPSIRFYRSNLKDAAVVVSEESHF